MTTTTEADRTHISKSIFLRKIAELYAVGNIADHDTNLNKWTKPSMASSVCGKLDEMLMRLQDDGVLTADERQSFYDNL